ncbi:DUF1501 domain-containing protein, partial [bacterium]|nr:DUF1501 domain-containing protein [bacterium]
AVGDDEPGFKADVNPTYSYSLHATALHLPGLDRARLSYDHNGIDRRLTGVHGYALGELLA